MMRAVRSTVREALGQARQLPASLSRTARWPLALGALLLAASTATAMATANTPPTITSATMSPAVLNEGQTSVLTLSFTDPNPGDYHTLRLKWADEPLNDRHTEVIQIPAGQTSIQVPHAFRDSVAGSSGSKVQVTLYDRQTRPGAPNDNTEGAGQDVEFVPIAVNNVAPAIPHQSVKVRVQGKRTAIVQGTVVDPGTSDTVTVSATWWDPTSPAPKPCRLDKTNRQFQCEHTYSSSLPAGTYDIFLDAWDDDGAQGVYTTSVRIP